MLCKHTTMNDFFPELIPYLTKHNAQLVAVSKKQSPQQIMELYNMGQRIFGENRAQELVEKAPLLPDDIQWHMIGHLQRNKLKQVLPLVTMIQSVDSQRLLEAVNKMLSKMNKKLDILLQFHIAEEDSKYGFSLEDASKMLAQARLARYVRQPEYLWCDGYGHLYRRYRTGKK
jgi:PLP dependent protein